MRRSELLALRWEDVDFDAGRFSVHRALVSVAYELHESNGKTSSARRCIDVALGVGDPAGDAMVAWTLLPPKPEAPSAPQ